MKKLLLFLLCSSPLMAMQPNQEQLEQARFQKAAKPVAVTALLLNGTIMTVAKGGCTVFGPLGMVGLAGVAGAKYAYDRSKGN